MLLTIPSSSSSICGNRLLCHKSDKYLHLVLSILFAISSSGSRSGISGCCHTHTICTNSTATANSVLNIYAHPNQTYTINKISNKGSKGDYGWIRADGKNVDSKGEHVFHNAAVEAVNPTLDVKITVDAETDHDPRILPSTHYSRTSTSST